MKLSNGRKIEEGIIGLSDGAKDTYVMVYGGYDSAVTTMVSEADLREYDEDQSMEIGTEVWASGVDSYGPPSTRVVTAQDRKELASEMIARWRKWGGLPDPRERITDLSLALIEANGFVRADLHFDREEERQRVLDLARRVLHPLDDL